jgi:asparagine synthase (glutamine-hydrolysing)
MTSFRFVIAFGTSGKPEERLALNVIRHRLNASADQWQEALNQVNLVAAYVPPPRVRRLPLLHDTRGVIFGELYDAPRGSKDPSLHPVSEFSNEQSASIVNSKGRSLMSDFWGHYVAVIRCPETASMLIIRSPVSPLPCFYFQAGTVRVLFSCISDGLMLALRDFSINWDSITAQVVGGDYLTNETGINEIRNLHGGEAISFTSAGETIETYWDPKAFLNGRSSRSFADAVHDIRRTTEHCVHALASSHDNILVCLSGGLDSSIILSAVTRAPHRPSVAALNYFSHGCGDERGFARQMAHAADCPLIEKPRNDRTDLRRITDCNFTAQPVLNFSAPDTEARTVTHAREHQATAIFDGELGDNVFGNNPSPGALIECLRLHAPGRIFLGAVMDYSMLTRQSLWRTLGLLRIETHHLSAESHFRVSEEVIKRYGKDKAQSLTLTSAAAQEHYREMSDRFLHPWLQHSRLRAPGSHMLMYGLIVATSTAYHSPFSRRDDPPRISPFISQPLVELVLQTPPHLHFESGMDRALARSAYSDVLPSSILQRGLGKGGPNLWARDVVESNTAFLREFLLDGILVQRNLIDRAKVESALSPTIVKSTSIVGDIFAKLYIESWLRKAQDLLRPSLSRQRA